MNENNFDHIIEQPLLTEEGFLNEACLNELNAAIRNMPKTFERLAENPEWLQLGWVFRSHITAAFAKWAIKQAPLGVPSGLDHVASYLHECLKHECRWNANDMAELSLCQINKALYAILYEQGISDFDAWNKGNDFIDLDALLRNVCVDIRNERRAQDAFNAKHPI